MHSNILGVGGVFLEERKWLGFLCTGTYIQREGFIWELTLAWEAQRTPGGGASEPEI